MIINIKDERLLSLLRFIEESLNSPMSEIVENMLYETWTKSEAHDRVNPEFARGIVSLGADPDSKELTYRGTDLFQYLYSLFYAEQENSRKILKEYALIQKLLLDGAEKISEKNDAPQDDKWN